MAAPKRKPVAPFAASHQQPATLIVDLIEGVEGGRMWSPEDFRASAKSSLREVAARARKLREQS